MACSRLTPMDYILISVRTRRNFEYETGGPYCLQSIRNLNATLHFVRHFFWLAFRRPDCNANAGQVGGPDAGPSRAGTGPWARGCPTLP